MSWGFFGARYIRALSNKHIVRFSAQLISSAIGFDFITNKKSLKHSGVDCSLFIFNTLSSLMTILGI